MIFSPDVERYSPAQVAWLLGVHIATVWRWILRGVRGRKLASVMIGGRRYVLQSDLDAFLSAEGDQHRPAPPTFRERGEVAGAQLDARGVRATARKPSSTDEIQPGGQDHTPSGDTGSSPEGLS
jgi:hypothetical protein